jgi:hypothetical protein
MEHHSSAVTCFSFIFNILLLLSDVLTPSNYPLSLSLIGQTEFCVRGPQKMKMLFDTSQMTADSKSPGMYWIPKESGNIWGTHGHPLGVT